MGSSPRWCWTIEPRARGEGFLFTDRVVGGAVPRRYIPAVAEAAACVTGLLGVQEALAKADPVLFEPIRHVAVTVPNAFTAGAQRLLAARGGRILGYAERESWSGWDDVEALVPEAEAHDRVVEVRSQSMGLGTYMSHFDHLAEARHGTVAIG